MRNPQFYVSGKKPIAEEVHKFTLIQCCTFMKKSIGSDISTISEAQVTYRLLPA